MPFALLTHGRTTNAKTAHALLRYRASEVACVVDADVAPAGARKVLPWAPEVPVVASAKEALELGASDFVVGIAPIGGRLPDRFRPDIRAALEAGRHVVNGMHTFLGDDAELATLARQHGGRITDLRRPPKDPPIWSGKVLDLEVPVVLTVGTDCSVGKMTATVEMARAARDAGVRAAWVATGQTGMLLDCAAGHAVDAIPGDFMPGVTEQDVLTAAQNADVVIVEGQGAITHPAYGPVSQALIFGSAPQVVVMVHHTTRTWKHGFENISRVLPPLDEWTRNEPFLLRPCRLAAVAAWGGELHLKDAPVFDPLADAPGLWDAVWSAVP